MTKLNHMFYFLTIFIYLKGKVEEEMEIKKGEREIKKEAFPFAVSQQLLIKARAGARSLE